ncbi:MAG: hypothetical protein LBT00_00565 [Spirochaetaceae bacterium]|nr:hypothetical protein [Spirochaetaceae bacterium]
MISLRWLTKRLCVSWSAFRPKALLNLHRHQAQSEGTIPYPRHPVIASEPRHRKRAPSLRAGGKLPSEAIQCEDLLHLDCFAALRLAMTTPAASLRASPSSLRAGGKLPSEAIQCKGLLHLDCFAALRLAMTTPASYPLNLRNLDRPIWCTIRACSKTLRDASLRRDSGALRGRAYNPPRPVSGFRPGRGTPTVCFSRASVRGRLGYAHKTMHRMILSP